MAADLEALRKTHRELGRKLREAEKLRAGQADIVADVYNDQRERAARRKTAQTKAAQNIGAPPAIVNPLRRQGCKRNFGRFCKTYLPGVFSRNWSKDHKKALRKIQHAVLRGGLFALAMPRGSGKTSLILAACIWALLYGHHHYVSLVAASSGKAETLLSALKAWLEESELLFEDFPEACHPIRSLDRSAHKAKGQHIDGKFTRMEWGASLVILPQVEGSSSYGAIISTAGLDSADIRGQMRAVHGRIVRPSFVALDDPQTRESAKSLTQCQTREAILSGDILGMAGPGERISAFLPCTVIRKGDMADRMLDRKAHPQWQGEKMKMVYRWPEADNQKKLLEEYDQLRQEDFIAGGDGASATDFWRTHQLEIEEGAEVAWAERFEPGEVSAMQHAWNLRLRDPIAFAAEYQNDPIEEVKTEGVLTADEIAAKVNKLPRGTLHLECTKLTASIDVHADILYWVACGWSEKFTGYVIDYGTFPEQPVTYFSQADPPRTLSMAYPSMGEEGRIREGLEALTKIILVKQWAQEDGPGQFIVSCPIDSGYQMTLVHDFCRLSEHKRIVLPSRGRGITAGKSPLNETKQQLRERRGPGWYYRASEKRALPVLNIDVNFWKSFLQARWRTAIGDPGCLSIFGDNPREHRLFAEHLSAEGRQRTKNETTGRECDEWNNPPGRDNHWLDCVVGAAVAASMEGCAVPGLALTVQPAKPYSIIELKRQADERKRG